MCHMVKKIHICEHYFQERVYCTRAGKGQRGTKLSCVRPMPVITDDKDADKYCNKYCKKVNSGWKCHACRTYIKGIYHCTKCNHHICDSCK